MYYTAIELSCEYRGTPTNIKFLVAGITPISRNSRRFVHNNIMYYRENISFFNSPDQNNNYTANLMNVA